MTVTNYGPNLQKLVESGCVNTARVNKFTKSQIEAIEKLSFQEVSTLIRVFEEVGECENVWMI